jgi:tetratricopeptide (TPR) repeat protein
VLQNAQKLVEKKKYDKAVLEYQKIIQEDPNDARVLLKIGDLQSKMEAYADAVATYERVGSFYAAQGFALKAIAVFKQIREIIAKQVPQLDERYAHITPKLAELYHQLGLTSDALAAFDEVATRLQRQGRDADAIAVFRRIVELDPTNPLPHLRLAEALSRAKDTDGAVTEFALAASQLVKLQRRDDAIKVFERLLHHKPDPLYARLCAELYLSRGQPSDGMLALSKLQICFQANPKDLDTLALLARAFHAIGQGTKALEVQKEMARIARDQGKTDLFRDLVEKLSAIAPHDEAVRQLASLGSGHELGQPASSHQGPQGHPPPAAQHASRAHGSVARPPVESIPPEEIDGELEEIDEEQLLDEDTHAPTPFAASRGFEERRPGGYAPYGGSATSPAAVPHEGVEVVDEVVDGTSEDERAEIVRIVADAASFRRARLVARAIDTLRGGIERFPRGWELHEALRDTLREAGRTGELVEQLYAMASLAIDALDAEAAVQSLDDLLSIDPTHARALDMMRELGYADPAPEADGGAPLGYDPNAPLPSYDLEEIGPDYVAPAYGTPAPPTAFRRPIPPAGAPSRFDRIDDPFAGEAPLPSFPLDAPDSETSFDLVGRKSTPGRAEPSAPRASGGPELEEALDEAEFFISRGLLEDARTILNELLARLPNHPLVRERVLELEAHEQSLGGSGTRAMPRSAAAPSAALDIDASLELLEGLEVLEPEAPLQDGDQQVDVEEVFAKFKAGVAKQISVDDAQSHYDLGVAYKEMGLVDDAIHEFEIAARDPKRECICHSMIGMIHVERGSLNEAIDAFMRGLHAPQRTPEQETVLSFEVGAAYEAKRMHKEALAFYTKVQRRDPGFRDVQERVRRLSKPGSMPPPLKAAAGADDEFDRAFDDIFGSGTK